MKDGAESSVTVGAAVVALVGQSNERTGLILSNSGAAAVSVGTRPSLAVGEGVILPPAGMPVKLCKCEVGDWIKKRFYAIGGGAGNVVGIVELFGEKE